MTPDDIRSQRFTTRLVRGVNPEEVAAFLEDVADAYDELQTLNAALGLRRKELEDEVQALVAASRQREPSASGHIDVLRAAALREVEALLHDAQAQAETLIEGAKERDVTMLRDAEAARARAQAEAEALVVEARAHAEAIVAAAREQEAALHAEIERLTQSRLQLVDDIRAMLDTYQQWLATVDPRGRARGRREALGRSGGSLDEVVASDDAKAG
jgi:DivIVA domain-containing protein